MNITCKHCGSVLAKHEGKTIFYRGAPMPIQDIDLITFRCPCGRLRDYYIRDDDRRTIESGQIITKGA